MGRYDEYVKMAEEGIKNFKSEATKLNEFMAASVFSVYISTPCFGK